MLRLLFLLCVFTAPAQAAPLVADLSNYRIDIDASFNGTRLFLFGARNDPGDIVVVVRGPFKSYVVRKKERMGGLWINTEQLKFRNLPAFYMLASGGNTEELTQNGSLRMLGVGERNILPSVPARKQYLFREFSEAFLKHQEEKALYHRQQSAIQFMGETLFKTTVEFPDDIPAGTYTAEIYLISDGEVVGMQSTPISVVKSGVEALIYDTAHQHPALYGLCAIALALFAGWFASRLFQNK